MASEPLHIVYISRLAPHRDSAVFGNICLLARARNIDWGISGVLLFDGERFLQWLCGPPDKVSRLMRAIVADERHVDLRVLLETTLPATASAQLWRAGFVDTDALDEFMAVDMADHGKLLDGLSRLVGQPVAGKALLGIPADHSGHADHGAACRHAVGITLGPRPAGGLQDRLVLHQFVSVRR